MRRLPWFLLLLCTAAQAAADLEDCLPAAPLPLFVQIGAAPPRQALLIGGSAPALRVIDAQSGALLWSAGAASPVSQSFADMSAAFAGSFVALDTNHDGLQDRLYAGDLAGRLWRFDLHNSAPAEAWMSGGVFADFSNEAGRGFRAPPDVSLVRIPGAAPWFDIAIGSAAPGRVGAHNRFYLLRDHAPFESWNDAQYRDWPVLHESDLLQVTSAGEPLSAVSPAGWFLDIGDGDILSASLTVAGRAVVAIAASATSAAAGCRSAFSVATLDLAHGQLLTDATGQWRRQLPGDLTIASTFTLAVDAAGADPLRARCTFGGTRVGDCDLDLHPHRTWWRREDAE